MAATASSWDPFVPASEWVSHTLRTSNSRLQTAFIPPGGGGVKYFFKNAGAGGAKFLFWA